MTEETTQYVSWVFVPLASASAKVHALALAFSLAIEHAGADGCASACACALAVEYSGVTWKRPLLLGRLAKTFY